MTGNGGTSPTYLTPDIVTDTMNEFFVDNCGCYSCGQFVQSAFYTLLHITRTIGIGKPSPNGGI